MSSRKATESFCFVPTTQYIYEEDNKSVLEPLGRQATFKFEALWSVRDGKGLRYSAFCHSVYLCVLHDSCTKYSINCLVFLIERDCSV